MNYPIKKKWQLAKRVDNDLIRQILINRGVNTPQEQEKFLKPNFDRDFLDPFLLKGMNQVVERLKLALKNQEVVAIFGDYDADGIPATAVMVKGLKALGLKNIVPLIPNRDDGYGLNQKVIEKVKKAQASLLITLDNGITAKAMVQSAKNFAIETIIIDHHEVIVEKKPEAFVIINPKQSQCHYPDKSLCACALAFKTIWALTKSLEKNTQSLKWLLDLVAIATISDMVPLLKENRLLAYYGLIVLNKTHNLGLKKLITEASLKFGEIDAYHVGFIIAPRLNAPSRMAKEKDQETDANLILKLLTTEDEKEALILAKNISQINEERQRSLEETVKEALVLAEKQVKENKKTIVLAKTHWPTGVVGLVASRICEIFARPAFIFGQVSGAWVGSARSIKAFPLVDNLSKVENLLDKFGGHAMAAGMTITKDQMKSFTLEIEKVAAKTLSPDDMVKTFFIDGEVAFSDLSIELTKKINQLAPFGNSNPQPVLKIVGEVSDQRLMGKNQDHFCFMLGLGDKDKLKIVAFNHRELNEKFQNRERVEVLMNLKINEWNGSTSVQGNFIDYKNQEDML